jgi:hypothetical protein
MGHLPADLDRLGDQLAAGAARAIASRRRRLALRSGVAAGLMLTALAPAALGPAEDMPSPPAALLLASAPATPTGCDQPRGGRFEIPACRPAPALRIGRPGRW